jgi:hypothetical protein
VRADRVEPYRRTYARRLTPRRVKFLRDPRWLNVVGRGPMRAGPAKQIRILSRPQFRLTAGSWFRSAAVRLPELADPALVHVRRPERRRDVGGRTDTKFARKND